MSELASQCSTQPPSYDWYSPLEDQGAPTDPERLPPRDVPIVNGSELGLHDERSSDNLRDEDVVMTWNNDHEIFGQSGAVEVHLAHQPLASAAQQHNVVFSPLRRLQIPVEVVPNSTQTRRPKKKITYSFSPFGSNAMVLLPPANARDSRPQYYISVSLNCFMPLSHITTVYRGANDNAPRVGEFELGIISISNGRLQMGNQAPVSLLSVLTKHGSRENARWSWKPHCEILSQLYWDFSSVPFDCKAKFAGSQVYELVAQFTSNIQPILIQSAEPMPALSQLQVLPAGQRCLDDILMSLLIAERKRLTPKTKTDAQLRTLFNY